MTVVEPVNRPESVNRLIIALVQEFASEDLELADQGQFLLEDVHETALDITRQATVTVDPACGPVDSDSAQQLVLARHEHLHKTKRVTLKGRLTP